MPSDPSSDVLAGANESMQENLTRSEPTILASYGLIGAILFFGGAGYVLDRWMGSAPWLLLTGFGVGLIVGFVRLYRRARRS